ncbi:MAG: hypothetical protein MI974_08775 [Chitinophagales bacterium]|nr:hypothetical protein [Chitinophagales bacterium]
MNRILSLSLCVISILSFSGSLFAQSFSISVKVLGIESDELFYLNDFTYELYADGEKLDTEYHRPSSRISDKFVILLKSKSDYAGLTVKFNFNNYEQYVRNIRVDNLKENMFDLGVIKPTPKPLMISRVLCYPPSVTDSLIQFIVTFRNSTNQTIEISELEIYARVKPNCTSPSPIFAKIRINKNIFYQLSQSRNVIRGSASHPGQKRISTLFGNIHYDECTLHEVHLKMNLSAIISGELHSQMIIELPNSLNVYDTDYSNMIDFTIKERVDELHEIFKRIPDVDFRFKINIDGQNHIRTSRFNFKEG